MLPPATRRGGRTRPRVLYLRSEQFYSAFFRSLQEKTTDRFALPSRSMRR